MKKVAIITINYNGKEDTLELLGSLKNFQFSNFNFQIKTIVVDNGSEDGSVSEIHKKYPEIDILQTGENLGFSGGYNKGIEYAKVWGADYFLLINNDCLIKDNNLLESLIKTLEGNIGLVSPKIYFAPSFEFHKDKYSKEDLGKVIWYAGGKFDWDNIGNIHRGLDEVDKGQYDLMEEAGVFSGACVLIKKEVLDKLGGFDEKYFLYFEDSDLAKRAKDAGFKIFYNGHVSIFHKVSRSTGIGSSITDYYHTRNRLIFGIKYGKLRTKIALLRQALWLFIIGRPAQRRGILDYYLGVSTQYTLGVGKSNKAEYPIKLSIGIVNYNTADLTKKLLDSIFKNTKTPGVQSYSTPGVGIGMEMEVIVLDNGNVDPCKDRIKAYLPRIKYLKNKENMGFSKGYNKTIKYSLGRYFLMLNSDVEVLDDSLKEIIKAEDQFKGEAVLGGKLIFPDGSNQDSAFHLPTLTGAFKEYFLSKIGSYFMFEPLGFKPTRVEGLVMACLLIPKKVLRKVGFLDEGSFIFFEDIEYAKRLRQFGVPLYFVPTAKFIHHHGASTKRIGVDKAYGFLQRASQNYHGKFYYLLLSLVLKLGQKLNRVKTPVSRWVSEKP